MIRRSTAHEGNVLVLVGTRKGSFFLSSGPDRRHWHLSGPHIPGSDVFHLAWDSRTASILAAVNHAIWGPHIEHSRDLGATWTAAKQ
jgi:hypothetical protein